MKYININLGVITIGWKQEASSKLSSSISLRVFQKLNIHFVTLHIDLQL